MASGRLQARPQERISRASLGEEGAVSGDKASDGEKAVKNTQQSSAVANRLRHADRSKAKRGAGGGRLAGRRLLATLMTFTMATASASLLPPNAVRQAQAQRLLQ